VPEIGRRATYGAAPVRATLDVQPRERPLGPARWPRTMGVPLADQEDVQGMKERVQPEVVLDAIEEAQTGV